MTPDSAKSLWGWGMGGEEQNCWLRTTDLEQFRAQVDKTNISHQAKILHFQQQNNYNRKIEYSEDFISKVPFLFRA